MEVAEAEPERRFAMSEEKSVVENAFTNTKGGK
jgi:hypothetical protein